MKLILEEKDVNIEVENPGVLEVPKDKKVYDLPVSHFKKLIDKKGREKIIRAITNLEVWNKNDDPKIASWAKKMKKSLEGYGEKKAKNESLKESNELPDKYKTELTKEAKALTQRQKEIEKIIDKYGHEGAADLEDEHRSISRRLRKINDTLKEYKENESLKEDSHERWYVTLYGEDWTSGPEEGGWTSYGKTGVKSLSFDTKEEAEKEYERFVKENIDNGDIIINEYPAKQGGKATVLEDKGDGSEYLIALENSHTRGSHEAPALSWAETELDYKPEKAYFDRKTGKRTTSPSAKRKQKERKAELDFIYKNAIAEINMAETKDDLMDAIDEVGKLDDERMNDIFIRVSDKMKELGIGKNESLTESSLSDEIERQVRDANKATSLEDFIGRPLKEFLRTVDHRDRISLEYGNPKDSSHGLSGRVHDVPWNAADDIITEIKKGDGKYYDWVINTK